jgi:hypothetical protein
MDSSFTQLVPRPGKVRPNLSPQRQAFRLKSEGFRFAAIYQGPDRIIGVPKHMRRLAAVEINRCDGDRHLLAQALRNVLEVGNRREADPRAVGQDVAQCSASPNAMSHRLSGRW